MVELIESILANDLENAEILFIDDGSTDNSQEILNEFKSEFRVILNKENRGANFCRNQGTELSKNNLIVFVDADDIVDPIFIKERLNMIHKNPNFDMWIFPMAPLENRESKKWILSRVDNLLDRFLSHEIPFQTMQVVWNKQFLQRIGGWDENLIRLQDPELHTRALMNGARLKVIDTIVPDCYYRTSILRINDANAYCENTGIGVFTIL